MAHQFVHEEERHRDRGFFGRAHGSPYTHGGAGSYRHHEVPTFLNSCEEENVVIHHGAAPAASGHYVHGGHGGHTATEDIAAIYHSEGAAFNPYGPTHVTEAIHETIWENQKHHGGHGSHHAHRHPDRIVDTESYERIEHAYGNGVGHVHSGLGHHGQHYVDHCDNSGRRFGHH